MHNFTTFKYRQKYLEPWKLKDSEAFFFSFFLSLMQLQLQGGHSNWSLALPQGENHVDLPLSRTLYATSSNKIHREIHWNHLIFVLKYCKEATITVNSNKEVFSQENESYRLYVVYKLIMSLYCNEFLYFGFGY